MNFKLAVTRLIPDTLYLKILYYKHFKKWPDLRNPKTFNEKLQWLKLHDRKQEYVDMVDKLNAKSFVAQKIGEQHVIETYGSWDSPEQIDFDSLPDQFVIKWNHDSGSVVICRDKSTFDREAALAKLAKGKKYSGFWYGREWPYKNVDKKVFAEKYLEDGNDCGGLVDYKFYCFGGEPKFLYVSQGLEDYSKARISFLTLDWEFEPFYRTDFPPFETLPKKPVNFDHMVQIARTLSKGTPFSRIDLYEIDGQVYFSEITFYPCSGLMPFSSPEWDEKIGDWLTLPGNE